MSFVTAHKSMHLRKVFPEFCVTISVVRYKKYASTCAGTVQ